MDRVALVLAVVALGAGLARAQEPGPEAPVRLDIEASGVTDGWWGRLAVDLALSRPAPWRVAAIDAPPRLVIDLGTADWGSVDVGALDRAEGATGARTEVAEDGWPRLVIDLAGPVTVAEAGMAADADGGARLSLRLDPADGAEAAPAGVPPDGVPPDGVPPDGVPPDEVPPDEVPPDEVPPDGAEGVPPTGGERLVVAIDPGHGGLDPGAERGGLRESHLMLALGLELSEAAARAGMVPVLTRSEDVFVPLAARMTVAREAGADVLISLHADALEADAAFGASVYTLSGEAAGDASARMVERHERRDLVAGLDLGGADDAVATALLDLARQDTGPASRRLAQAVVAGLGDEGARVNSRPLREARLAVLDAADFPSVLVEAGFLSDAGDRARLATSEGRRPIVAGLVAALGAWAADEAARAPLRLR